MVIGCTVAGWGTWSGCSSPCGGGTRLRTRDLILGTSSSYTSSTSCILYEEGPCNAQICGTDVPPSQNCTGGSWGPWSACTAACTSVASPSDGIQIRLRNIDVQVLSIIMRVLNSPDQSLTVFLSTVPLCYCRRSEFHATLWLWRMRRALPQRPAPT